MSNQQENRDGTPVSAQRKAGGKGSLLVIFLTIFIDLLGFGIVLPLLPIYADQFATDSGGWVIGLLMASFSIMQFLFAPLWGALSDRIGRRPVIIVGLTGSVVFYLLFGIATIYQSLTMLFVTRIGAGIAGATVATAQAYIADTTTNENRARGMALIGIAFGLGFTLGPLFAVFAVPGGDSNPGPGPGFVAAALSAVALGMAIFMLPESRVPGKSASAVKKWWDTKRFRRVVGNRAIAILLAAFFVCIFSFANFETTLSLLLKGPEDLPDARFHFSFEGVCYTFALIGFLVAMVQGGIVRPLTKYVSPARLAIFGALVEVLGFATLTWSILAAAPEQALTWLYVSLVISVVGYACIQPNLYALLSRWSDPQRQGETLGVGQSVNALARIFGSGLGIPMLKVVLFLPYLVAAVLMFFVAVLVYWAARYGRDFEPDEDPVPADQD
ncbi:MAG: MFS transporter [Planctomycetota bacterium]|nr:MFS transporter [Planctomycetota bacterium]